MLLPHPSAVASPADTYMSYFNQIIPPVAGSYLSSMGEAVEYHDLGVEGFHQFADMHRCGPPPKGEKGEGANSDRGTARNRGTKMC